MWCSKHVSLEEFYFKIKFGAVYCATISLLPFVLRWFGVGAVALKDE